MQPSESSVIQMHGCKVAIPDESNLAWTHAVPASRPYAGRRISITSRTFVQRTTADSE